MRAEILVGRERRRRWSADDKLQIVREAFAPGARVALMARRRDVSCSQIYHWRAAPREGRLDGSAGDIIGFVPVALPTARNDDVPGTDSFAGGSPIEIGLAGGRCLKVSASLPSTELRRLIRAVERAWLCPALACAFTPPVECPRFRCPSCRFALARSVDSRHQNRDALA